MKLIVNVFERAKSKLTSAHSINRISSDSDNESDKNHFKDISSSGPLIIQQQPRLSLSKWLCTNSSSVGRSILSSKSNKVRRSSSWRSLKERANNNNNNSHGYFTSRTLSADELHRNQKINSIQKQPNHQISNSPVICSNRQRQKASGLNSIRLSNCDASISLSTTNSNKQFHRLSSKKSQQSISRKQMHSGGGDSGYSEESFVSSLKRPLHTSCPHCHCEQRSSFNHYQKSTKHSSSSSSSTTDSSLSDTTIHKNVNSTDLYYHLFQQKQSLSASRSYPHIKPLPRTIQNSSNPSSQQPRKRTKSLSAKRRRRHLSCDGSLWTKTQNQQQQTNLISSTSKAKSESNNLPIQRHFTTIGMINNDPTKTYSKPFSTLPKNSHVFGELNLAAIELDSIRTLDYYRSSFSSDYSSSLSSSSSSINKSKQTKSSSKHRKRTYLVWHQYENSAISSPTNRSKTFSVVRGDQVKLLKRIGKSTLLVQKEDDGSIGFLPQSCLAHDQINSFLSVKGLKETVL